MKSLKYLIVAAGITGLLLTAPMAISQEPMANVEEEATASYEGVRNIETARQLRDIIKNDESIAVDFGATWCGPCREYDPIFEKVAKEYEEKVVFCKVVLDKIAYEENKKIVDRLRIKAIPRTMLFKNGELVYNRKGLIEEKELKELIDTYLLEKK